MKLSPKMSAALRQLARHPRPLAAWQIIHHESTAAALQRRGFVESARRTADSMRRNGGFGASTYACRYDYHVYRLTAAGLAAAPVDRVCIGCDHRWTGELACPRCKAPGQPIGGAQ